MRPFPHPPPFRRRVFFAHDDDAACVAQFAEITKVPFPPIYDKFLSVIGIFSFDLVRHSQL